MTETAEPNPAQSGRWRGFLNGVTSVALLVAATVVTWSTLAKSRPAAPPGLKVPSSVQSIQGLPSRGRTTAAVVLIEYSDFQCPFCRKFVTEVLPTLEGKYISTGRVLFVFRHYPLEKLHPFARSAADAAACAFRQDRFWETHDQLFSQEGRLDATGVLSAVTGARVDRDEWRKCITAQPVREVAEDIATAVGLGLRGTPSFLLGISTAQGVRVTKVWSGASPTTFFSQAIEEALLLASKSPPG